MDAIAPRRCPGSGVRVGSAGGPAGHTARKAPTTTTATTVGALNRPHHRPTRRLVARPEPPRASSRSGFSVEEKPPPVRPGQRLGPEVPALPVDVLWRELQQIRSVARKVLFAAGVGHYDLTRGEIR